jgi:hypothetical protein
MTGRGGKLNLSTNLNTMKIPVEESIQRIRKCIPTYGLKKNRFV